MKQGVPLRQRMGWYMVAVGIFCLSLAALGYHTAHTDAELVWRAQDPHPDPPGWIAVRAYGLVVLEGVGLWVGIVFGYMYERLQTLRQQGVAQVHLGQELKFMLTSTHFYLALLASPILFSMVVLATPSMDWAAGLLVAFQNGFFWQKVMPLEPIHLRAPPSTIR